MVRLVDVEAALPSTRRLRADGARIVGWAGDWRTGKRPSHREREKNGPKMSALLAPQEQGHALIDDGLQAHRETCASETFSGTSVYFTSLGCRFLLHFLQVDQMGRTQRTPADKL